MKRMLSLLLSLTLLLALLAGCDTDPETGTPPTTTAPVATAAGGRVVLDPAIDKELFGGSGSYETLMAGMDAAIAAGAAGSPLILKSMGPMRNGVGNDMSAGAPTAANSAGPGMQAETAHSSTNVQVAGVDEADIVKTDGRYLYYVANDRVYVVDTTAAKPKVIHTFTFKRNVKDGSKTTHESPVELYLDPVGKRLTIIVQGSQYEMIPRPTEPKPEETKPEVTKPEETKPEEKKPEETKPEETKPEETRPTDTRPVEPPDGGASAGTPASAAAPVQPETGVASDLPAGIAASSRMGILPMNQRTYVVTRVYSVADPAKPSLLRTFSQEGSYLSSRLVDGTAFVLTNKYEYRFFTMRPMPAAGVVADDSIAARESASGSGAQPNAATGSSGTTTGASGVASDPKADLQQFKDTLPKVSGDPDQAVWETLPADRIGIVPQGDPSAQLIISAIPVANESLKPSTVSLLGASGIVYASKDNIYLANHDYQFPTKNPEDMKQSMKIYRLSIAGGRIAANGTGSVPGFAINQFAMDEHNGHFRIATTMNSFSRTAAGDNRNTSESAVYVLDKGLKVVGQVGKLGPDETIRSVRFMGDRAYVVTFRTTDPLYVLDLKTPTAPKVLGELKIPGFSTYLHPYGDDLLLGFGYDAVVEGSNAYQTGIKVSLFDISDLSSPKERSTLIFGGQGSYSLLDHSHKALLFSKEQNLIAFPASIANMSRNGKMDYRMIFQGLVVLAVDNGKLVLRGGLGNAPSLKDVQGEGLPHDRLTPADQQAIGGHDSITRAVMLNGRIVTLSGRLVRQYGLDSLKLEGETQLAGFEQWFGIADGPREVMPAMPR